MSREDLSSPPTLQADGPKPGNDTASEQNEDSGTPTPVPAPTMNRRNRPSRACTIRAAARLQAAQQHSAMERKQKPKMEQQHHHHYQQVKEQCSGGSSTIVTPLVGMPSEPAQWPRWNLRSTWELASILNFLHVSGFWVA
uniref:Uncharacterized protein n=1 Tax=Rhizophora mucronata TaxID=61149 RepID=A0A2P2LR15_RHIMU